MTTEREPSITTYTGIVFNILEPTFILEDIAHALSNTCRFAGHCNEFYSVAEHSVLVSLLMEKLDLGDPMVGLMHDGHEAYLSDVPSPFKDLFPDWCKMDEELEEKLYAHFHMPFPREAGCKEADVLAFFIERGALFPNWVSNETWLSLKYPDMPSRADKLIEKGWDIHCYDPWLAKKRFLDRYDKLQKQTGEG